VTSVPFDVAAAELHNARRIDGETLTRPGLQTITTVTAGSVYCGGFTLESPFSSEVVHYVFEQNTTTLDVVVRVLTEECFELFNMDIGLCPPDPVISCAVVNNQLMLNSPGFPCPYYGLIGGGLIPAVKVESENPDTGALDIPPGHVTSWGGRIVIATANSILISAPNAGSPDIRTFIPENVIPFPGTVYDLFQGPDGALYVFTSVDVYVVPVDTLAQAQIAQGFISSIPGVNTSSPRNACTSTGSILALGEDGLLFVTTGGVERVDLAPYEGKRFYTPAVESDDYRLDGEIFPTATGAVISFGARGFLLEVDLRNAFRSYTWLTSTKVQLVSVLTSRDGDSLFLLRDRLVMSAGNFDFDGGAVRGVACGRISVPADSSVTTRTVTVSTDAVGANALAYMGGSSASAAVPTLGVDAVIGTATWSATAKYYGRERRTVQLPINTRTADVQCEMGVDAGNRRIDTGDLEVRGQGRARRSR
jgi:hypothetical protein